MNSVNLCCCSVLYQLRNRSNWLDESECDDAADGNFTYLSRFLKKSHASFLTDKSGMDNIPPSCSRSGWRASCKS